MWEKITLISSQFTRLTNGRIEDGFTVANTALHTMQCGKNCKVRNFSMTLNEFILMATSDMRTTQLEQSSVI